MYILILGRKSNNRCSHPHHFGDPDIQTRPKFSSHANLGGPDSPSTESVGVDGRQWDGLPLTKW